MKKILITITAVLFFIWIMPLGIVIKPAFEKLACGGQRAICMCSSLTSQPGEGDNASYLSSTGASQQGPKRSGGSGALFWLAQAAVHTIDKLCFYHPITPPVYSFRYAHRIDHIPKA